MYSLLNINLLSLNNSWIKILLLGTVEGEVGVSQMTILLHKPYFVKATTKGKGGMEKIHKSLTTRGLWMTVVISHILPRFLIFPKKLIVRHSFFIERLSKLGCWKCFITKNQSFWLITLFLCYGNNPISLKNQTCHENKLGLIVPLLNHSPNYKEFRAKR